jgi:hypothetical protein
VADEVKVFGVMELPVSTQDEDGISMKGPVLVLRSAS